MAAITTERCLRPFLVALSDVKQLQINDVTIRVADLLQLSDAERQLRVLGGSATIIRNRCGWARTSLFRAGLIAQVARGVWRITDEGRAALDRFPSEIRDADLRKHYPSFKRWVDEIAIRARAKGTEGVETGEASATLTRDGAVMFGNIDEQMTVLTNQARSIIEEAVLERLEGMHWGRFEWLVEQLVVKLGYGSSADEVAGALRSGADEGVDGVIKEDRLGLGQIYLQAKRWQGTVGRPVIQSFVGAMHGKAQKGVVITTSSYSSEAKEYVASLQGIRIRLVDGKELASLMVDCGLGVSEERVHRTYRIDSDFFDEAE